MSPELMAANADLRRDVELIRQSCNAYAVEASRDPEFWLQIYTTLGILAEECNIRAHRAQARIDAERPNSNAGIESGEQFGSGEVR